MKLCQCGSWQHRGVPVPGPGLLRPEGSEVQIQSERGDWHGAQQVHEQRTPSATQHIRWHCHLTGRRPTLWPWKFYLPPLKLTWERSVSSCSWNQWVCRGKDHLARKVLECCPSAVIVANAELWCRFVGKLVRWLPWQPLPEAGTDVSSERRHIFTAHTVSDTVYSYSNILHWNCWILKSIFTIKVEVQLQVHLCFIIYVYIFAKSD